jgi:protease-4
VGLIEVLSAIEEAKTDNDIEGISILNNNSQLGMAQSKLYATLCKVLKIR